MRSKLFAGVLFAIFLINLVSAGCSIGPRSSCSGGVIIGMSDTTNAHVELATQSNYDYALCCSGGRAVCDGNNKILGLVTETNAHAEIGTGTTYAYDVCYSGAVCTSRTGSCAEGETSILSLTAETNAHVGGPDDYETKICCEVPTGCEGISTKDSCWSYSGENCTWYPPGTNTSAQGGGCCPDGEQWDSFEGMCAGTAGVCNSLWAVLNQIPGTSIRYSLPYEHYCAKVSNDLSYGLWTPVKVY